MLSDLVKATQRLPDRNQPTHGSKRDTRSFSRVPLVFRFASPVCSAPTKHPPISSLFAGRQVKTKGGTETSPPHLVPSAQRAKTWQIHVGENLPLSALY
jgi:hypothetical protein